MRPARSRPMLASMGAETNLVAVATDGSAGAALAVEWAAGFARSSGAQLLAIQVVGPTSSPESVVLDAAAEDDVAKAGSEPAAPGPDEAARARLLSALERSLPTDGIRARAVVESGEDVAAAILAAAGEADADVVVVGSSGMRGRKKFLLGNIANRVTHLAECTVVVVNTATGEPAPERTADSGRL